MRFTMRHTLARFTIFLLVLTVLGACDHDSDDYLPTAPRVSEALVLIVSATSLPADGVSRIDLEARISANADPAKRRITFTTSAGSLVGAAATDPKKLFVTASESGVARAQLVSAKEIGTALVGAAIDGVPSLAPRQIEIKFVPVEISAIIRLSVSRSTAPADGKERIQVFADVNRPAVTVSFTTNRGKFVSTNMATGSAVANAEGRATIDLVSTEVGSTRLSASFESSTVETTVEFQPVDDATIIQISLSDTDGQAPADGETVTQVFALVTSDSQEVTFTTSLGKFASSGGATATVPVASGDRATADLISHNKVGTARLTATVDEQYTAETSLEFVRALPARIVVLLGATELKASPSEKATIQVRLLRDIGTVTDNTVVEYKALDAESGEDLHFTFRNKEPSRLGVATAEVVAGATTFRKVARIIATVEEGGKVVSGEENIRIVNP
jgi:hypothetical protein